MLLRYACSIIAAFAVFLSGAWWNGDRKASVAALIFAGFILAVGLSGCSALYHACREGLCR